MSKNILYNFGESFIKWTHVLYQNPCSKIINNGHISDTMTLSKGVKQGWPPFNYESFKSTYGDFCPKLPVTSLRTLLAQSQFSPPNKNALHFKCP